MLRPNPYLAKQEALRQKCFEVACEITAQQFFDYMSIVLNDPKVMGKDVFGKKRLQKVHEAMKKLDKEYCAAWTNRIESDYCQEQIDAALKRIFGEIDPFNVRYPHLRETDYTKPFKEKKK